MPDKTIQFLSADAKEIIPVKAVLNVDGVTYKLDTNASVTVSGSEITIASGSVYMSGQPIDTTGNQVVSGSVYQMNNTTSQIVSGSVYPLGTQTVAGSVTAITSGSVTAITSGSVTAITSGSVTAITSGSVTAITSGSVTAITSGSVTAITSGSVTAITSGSVTAITSGSVTAITSGSVSVSNIPTNQVVSGSTFTEIVDDYGFHADCTPMNTLKVAQIVRLVGSTFTGSVIDTNFWTAAGSVGGTVTCGSCQLTLASGSAATGIANIQSVRTARYVGGASNYYRAVVQTDALIPDNVRRWGAYSPTDGAFFEASGSNFQITTRRTSSDTSVAGSAFNGTAFTMDTNAHVYEIYWTNSKVWFVIDAVLRHTVSATTAPWTHNTNLPIRAENYNGATVVSKNLYIRSNTINRLGQLVTQPTSLYQSGSTAGVSAKIGAGNLHSLVVGTPATGAVVTIADSATAGSTPAIFNFTWTAGAQANNQPFTLDFKGVPFYNGLSLVITGAAANVTLVYE